jgi:hypothetical protein
MVMMRVFEDTYAVCGEDGRTPSYTIVVRAVNDRPVTRMTFKFPNGEQAMMAVRRMRAVHTQQITDYIAIAETIVKPVILVRGSHEQRVSIPRQS